MTESEFSRPARIDTIGAEPRALSIEASAGERAALARRFGLQALDRLEADVSLRRTNQDIVAAGRVRAAAVQRCAVTSAPVPAEIDEPFEIHFRPAPQASPGEEEEIELGAQELDVVFYEGGAVDLGEAVAQTLALSLDPYPRAEGAAEALREAGVKDETEAGPFGALAALKDKLGG